MTGGTVFYKRKPTMFKRCYLKRFRREYFVYVPETWMIHKVAYHHRQDKL